MSTQQLVAARSKAAVKTRTGITNEQSQKLIQTMLTMSFGCLAFLRGLFPDDSFVDQKFVPGKIEKDYRNQNGSSDNSIKIKTLVRGKSNEIDMLLNWLEKGVFQSIKLKYLKAMSLGIFINESEPSNLLENYVFSFDYDNEENFQMKVGPTHNQDDTTKISLLDSRKMAQQLIRRFIIITQSLEPLPQRKFLTLRLMFNDNTPENYQPHFFRDATFEEPATIKIPLSTELDSGMAGCLDTRHHQISLKVLSAVESELDAQPESELVNIDPFDLIDGSTNRNLDYGNSQTTNLLGDILKSSQPNIQPTQAIATVGDDKTGCECGLGCPVDSTTLRTCKICRRVVHGICYGNSKSSAIERCLSCLYGNSLRVESRDFKDLMMLRKIYRFLARSRSFPNSIVFLVRQLCGPDFELDVESEDRIAFCLSALFYDGILVVDKEPGTQPSRFSNVAVLVDISGVTAPRRGVFNKGTQYAWSFNYNSPYTHSCFVDVLAESKQQIDDWLAQINYLRDTCLADLPASYELDSLKITDISPSGISDMGRKRKNLHEQQSVLLEHHSSTGDDDSARNSRKIRKISVSKKSLRSIW